MSDLPLLLSVFLLANLFITLVRVVRGPTSADRLLAALLFGTTGVAILLLLAYSNGQSALIDVALIFALLAAITGAAFAQRAWRHKAKETDDGTA
ncbi:monovalent cation/H+ antiporter complex subunit F [Oxalobacteraceae bacterium R-40]|uniref:Monovalent cation/H+ antiporter complex subunit F n=1 Tax=Keguizhuia sedimenti TaxID=3064264 RepID=A0ABU1BRG2_9BURK|nr:monovalent cation/H+ antiporter complex subunit F [Oxalobacteraceae bacterium R-40]